MHVYRRCDPRGAGGGPPLKLVARRYWEGRLCCGPCFGSAKWHGCVLRDTFHNTRTVHRGGRVCSIGGCSFAGAVSMSRWGNKGRSMPCCCQMQFSGVWGACHSSARCTVQTTLAWIELASSCWHEAFWGVYGGIRLRRMVGCEVNEHGSYFG